MSPTSRSDASRPPRLGLFGGTFDPPHNGHIVAAAAASHALELDAVWFVVAHMPWQKVGSRPITPAADRFALVAAALRDVPGLEASPIEIERGGPSYTVDTLAELRAQDPERDVFLIMGADTAAGLTTWERADEVRRGATMVIVDRPGIAASAPPDGWAFERVEIPRLDISSTDLRRRVRDGEPIDGLVPPAVSSAIRERGLYRGE